MSYQLSPALARIQRALDPELAGGGRGNRSDEELTAEQLGFRIVERDKRNNRLGWATRLSTAGGTFYALLKVFGS